MCWNKTNYYSSDLDYDKHHSINCCLIKKEYLPDPNGFYGGSFKYNFTKLKDEQCKPYKYKLDNNQQLFIEGDNNWSNENCKNNKVALENKFSIGSCRNVNKECIDFVTKEYCDKYRMQWSTKTCNEPFDFVFQDRIPHNPEVKMSDEEKKNLGVVNMFPSK